MQRMLLRGWRLGAHPRMITLSYRSTYAFQYSSTSGQQLTPMMRQYQEAKEKYPKHLVLFRMGDFFEIFNDDAKVAAKALKIELTARNKGEIPMCGFPHLKLYNYLPALVRDGHSIAICEQIQESKDRPKGSKDLLKREVIQLITPGTLTEDSLLNPDEHNFLVAIAKEQGKTDSGLYGLAQFDLSTGEMSVSPAELKTLRSTAFRLSPAELVVSKATDDEIRARLSNKSYDRSALPYLLGVECALTHVENDSSFSLNSFNMNRNDLSEFSSVEVEAIRTLLQYVHTTQCGNLPRIGLPQRIDVSNGDSLEIDPAAVRSLEIFRTTFGDVKGSLLNTINRTKTAAGSRLLSDRLRLPCAKLDVVKDRLDAVHFFLKCETARRNSRKRLASTADLSRSLQRVQVKRGGPRDLGSIGSTLNEARDLYHELKVFSSEPIGELSKALESLSSLEDDDVSALSDEVNKALIDGQIDGQNPPLPMFDRDGGFVRDGYSQRLDDFRKFSSRRKQKQARNKLEEKYKQETEINNLKIKSSKRMGYFVEVQVSKQSKLDRTRYFACGSTKEVARYKTIDLSDLEKKDRTAEDDALEEESAIFNNLCTYVRNVSSKLLTIASAISVIDVALGFAELASEKDLCRPEVDDSLDFEIKGGRHLVVEENVPFVTNHLSLNTSNSCWLITGPNMGGKSTYLRQNAHIAILAQVGSFVPAESVKQGIVDKIFCRVGASDELAADRSTFMVEMEEIATILQGATTRSLVVVDEVGRGTSIKEGFSIAQAVLEELANRQCRTLFATHFHKLTRIEHKAMANYYMDLMESDGAGEDLPDLTFLYLLKPGVCLNSYGLYTARLAGLPLSVILRARELLN